MCNVASFHGYIADEDSHCPTTCFITAVFFYRFCVMVSTTINNSMGLFPKFAACTFSSLLPHLLSLLQDFGRGVRHIAGIAEQQPNMEGAYLQYLQ